MRHWGVTKGKKVGVVGLVGLGHMAGKFAHALGAHVVVFTTSPLPNTELCTMDQSSFLVSRISYITWNVLLYFPYIGSTQYGDRRYTWETVCYEFPYWFALWIHDSFQRFVIPYITNYLGVSSLRHRTLYEAFSFLHSFYMKDMSDTAKCCSYKLFLVLLQMFFLVVFIHIFGYL